VTVSSAFLSRHASGASDAGADAWSTGCPVPSRGRTDQAAQRRPCCRASGLCRAHATKLMRLTAKLVSSQMQRKDLSDKKINRSARRKPTIPQPTNRDSIVEIKEKQKQQQ